MTTRKESRRRAAKIKELALSGYTVPAIARRLRIKPQSVREIVKGKEVISYNTDFDFDKFLFKEPWCLQDIVTVDFDIMKLATDRVYGLADSDRISNKLLQARLIREREQSPYPNKWVRSQDAYSVLCPDDPMGLGAQTHRALDDAIMEAWVLKALQ